MKESVEIKSAHGGTTLEFFNRTSNYYWVTLTHVSIHGTCRVYAYEPGKTLCAFFRDLAANWRGWEGKKGWFSLESELKFEATIDSTGHVSLRVQICSGFDHDAWTLSICLMLESGSLDRIASDLERFFERSRNS